MGYSEDEFKRIEEGYVPDAIARQHADVEPPGLCLNFESGHNEFHVKDDTCIEWQGEEEPEDELAHIELLLFKTRQELAQERQETFIKGLALGQELMEARVEIGTWKRRVEDGLRQMEASIEFFEIAHRAAVEALRAVKRELERKAVK